MERNSYLFFTKKKKKLAITPIYQAANQNKNPCFIILSLLSAHWNSDKLLVRVFEVKPSVKDNKIHYAVGNRS